MKRRTFLGALSAAIVGSAVAKALPSLPLAPTPPMRGLTYLINSQSKVLHGMESCSFPTLNGPVPDLGGAVLTPEMLTYTKRFLAEMAAKSSSVTEFHTYACIARNK